MDFAVTSCSSEHFKMGNRSKILYNVLTKHKQKVFISIYIPSQICLGKNAELKSCKPIKIFLLLSPVVFKGLTSEQTPLCLPCRTSGFQHFCEFSNMLFGHNLNLFKIQQWHLLTFQEKSDGGKCLFTLLNCRDFPRLSSSSYNGELMHVTFILQTRTRRAT